MKSRALILKSATCWLVVAGAFLPTGAQDRGRPFDASMTLEGVVEWVGRRLVYSRREAQPDSLYVRRVETRLAKAKGCTLSYWSTAETEGPDPVAQGYQSRELWTLDLRGLDPASIHGQASGQVSFRATGTIRNSIHTVVYQRDTIFATHGNRRAGRFTVRDHADAEEVATALRHAVNLCRQKVQ